MTLTCVQRKTEMFVWLVCMCFVCVPASLSVCTHSRVCVCVCCAKERGVQYESGAGQQSDGFGSSLTAVKDETWFHMC